MRILLLALFIALAFSEAESKCLAIYAPPPKYPKLPNGQRPEGKGLFICHIDVKTGWVMSVSIAKSTGFAILDAEATDCLKRWRFRAGCDADVKMPITFSHKSKT
jgi:TonB family protein